MSQQDAVHADFRQEVRSFLTGQLPPDMAVRGLSGFSATREDVVAWQKTLNAHGWGAPNWEPEHSGPGWTAEQRLIFEEESFLAGAPQSNVQAMTMMGPVLNHYGSSEQRSRFIPDILDANVIWCQGFSEPGAGSDLASLSTTAVRDGDSYVVNGQKIWTSQAHYADWVFLLVRTSKEGPKQAGITFLMADMRSPGISVRPIISIDGQHHLNETFYDNVRIPLENRIGEEGQGWEIAKFLLTQERTTSAADTPGLKRLLNRLRSLRSLLRLDEESPAHAASLDTELALSEIELSLIEKTVLQAISPEAEPDRWDAVSGSMIKQRASALHQTLSDLLVQVSGARGSLYFAEDELEGLTGDDAAIAGCAADYLYKRAATIYGGTKEIQYEIIAKELFRS